MIEDLLNTSYLGTAFLLLFASAELLYHVLKIKVELTRKYVHIATGLLTMLFPFFIKNQWFVLGLCSSFLLILICSIKLRLLPSINAVNRKTSGSILYPIIVYACFLVYLSSKQLMFYYLPILVLAISDPVAALIGKKWPYRRYSTFGHSKTLSGSLGFFVSTFFICSVLIIYLEELPLIHVIGVVIFVSLATTLAEAFSHNGFDNLTIPASAVIVLQFLNWFAVV